MSSRIAIQTKVAGRNINHRLFFVLQSSFSPQEAVIEGEKMLILSM